MGTELANWRGCARELGARLRGDRPSASVTTASTQLEMTGCENWSDIRGQPEPGRRFQGTASSPLHARGPPKPFPPRSPPPTPRTVRRRHSPRGSPGPLFRLLSQPLSDCSGINVYLAAFLTLLRAPPWKTRPCPVYLLNPTAL